MKSLRVVPIRFVDRNGNPTSPSKEAQSDCIPVVDVVVRSPSNASLEISCQALIDTGADYCVASRRILQAVGAPIRRSVNHKGATGATVTNLHDAVLVIASVDGFQIPVGADLAGQDDAHSHPAYPVILGRGLLRHGSLTLDYPANVFTWTCLV